MRSSFSFFFLIAVVAFPFCHGPEIRAQQGVAVRGRVFNALTCNGLGHLVIKLTPPKSSQYQTVLITNTDEQGNFVIEVPEKGDYYFSVYDGLQQVYGHVRNVEGTSRIDIALRPEGIQQPPTSPSSCESVPQKETRLLTPVALALSQGGDLYALDASDELLRFQVRSANATAQPIASFNRSWQANDLSIAGFGGEEHIFVVLVQSNLGQVLEYSVSGKFEQSWYNNAPIGGVGADGANRRVFLTEPTAGAILQLSLDTPSGAPKAYSQISGSQAYTLVVDEAEKKLYTADYNSGQLYALDLQSMALQKVAKDLGHPSALTFDSRNHCVLVADGPGATIWTVPVGASAQKPSVLLKSKPLVVPSGIAVASDGTVWVSDQSAHAIFQFSTAHTLLRTIR